VTFRPGRFVRKHKHRAKPVPAGGVKAWPDKIHLRGPPPGGGPRRGETLTEAGHLGQAGGTCYAALLGPQGAPEIS